MARCHPPPHVTSRTCRHSRSHAHTARAIRRCRTPTFAPACAGGFFMARQPMGQARSDARRDITGRFAALPAPCCHGSALEDDRPLLHFWISTRRQKLESVVVSRFQLPPPSTPPHFLQPRRDGSHDKKTGRREQPCLVVLSFLLLPLGSRKGITSRRLEGFLPCTGSGQPHEVCASTRHLRHTAFR